MKLSDLKEHRKSSSVHLSSRNVLITIFAWFLLTAICWILNETGIFHVQKRLMRISVLISCLFLILSAVQVKLFPDKKYLRYWLLLNVLVSSFTSQLMLGIHGTLFGIFPILVAAYYNDWRLQKGCIVAAVISILVSSILTILMQTFDVDFAAFLVYLNEPAYLADGIRSGMKQATVFSGKPALQYMFFFAVPNACVAVIIGLIVQNIQKSREASHVKQLEEIRKIQDKTIAAMSDIIEGRDGTTGGHVRRTSRVMEIFTDQLKKDDSLHTEAYWTIVAKAAPLHDIGKITVDDRILRKEGPLTQEEFEIIKAHTVKGSEMIRAVFTGIESAEFIRVAENIGRYHHEHFDGTGYPEGLKGYRIPLEARLMAYVDVLDALMSKRSYKEEMSFDEAFSFIRSEEGKLFDPELMTYFEGVAPKIRAYYQECRDQEKQEAPAE